MIEYIKKSVIFQSLFNLVKITACAWIALIINFVPTYIVDQAFDQGIIAYLTDHLFKHFGLNYNYFYIAFISDTVVYIAVTSLFLILFNVRAGKRLKNFNFGYILGLAAVPVVLHFILIILTYENSLFYGLAYDLCKMFKYILYPDVLFYYDCIIKECVLIIMPIFELFHIAAIITGYYIGYRKRKKERDALISEGAKN